MTATRTRRPAASAGDPILASKITAPGVPDWAVQRPRITKLIARATRWCPLTVVTGPPGAGKTMALAMWAATDKSPVAWVSLEGHDNRPGVFWSYVIAALRQSGVALPTALVAARGRAQDHVFLLRLASALAAQNPPVTLVLDDVHVLTEPKVLDGLDFVLRNVGPGLRLAVTSRMDPLLRLHRYRLAGELTEIRASDLAFSVSEAGLLMAQHGCTLSADSLDCLTRRTEGWAAGLRLAALSIGAHPAPERFIQELADDDSALTGYLVEEVLNAQPAEAREVLLSTSILAHVNAEAAIELADDGQAGGILQALAHTNTFIQPVGSGWYRYHTLFAEVLRLKLRHEHPDRMVALHQRAARWHARNGRVADAVRHAAEASDWPFAASIVVDGLAINEIIEPSGGQLPQFPAEAFRNMPAGQTWPGAQPYLVSAAMALAASQDESSAAALTAAEHLLARLPADQEPASRLTAALIRLAVSRRSGDLSAAAAAGARAQVLVSRVPDDVLAQHDEIRAQVLAARGAVELWLGHLDKAAQILDSGAAAATASGSEHERAHCLGHLALLEALRGRLNRAAELAAQATEARTTAGPRMAAQRSPAALAALAWVHLQHNELRAARGLLSQLNAALNVSPDRPVGTVAYLVAAYGGLAEGNPDVAEQFVARARSGWPVPAWLEQRLSLVESRVSAQAGDIPAALAAAERAGDNSLAVAPALAHVWAAAGDGESARRVLEPVLAAPDEAPERVRLAAWLVDAQLSYDSGDRARGHRSLASAMRLAEPEQLRLPFALERGWLGQVLRQEPELAYTHRRLFAPAPRRGQLPALPAVPDHARMPALVEPLTEREREVLRHVSLMLNTAEVASEMYISANTVKTHLKSIYRKLEAAHRGEAVRRARQLELI